jgi:hypothetical protein
MATRRQTRRYEVRATFRAPLPFVYRWCTEYTSGDGRYSGEGYQRRILSRSNREVVFEDLYDTRNGWIWIHRTVQLLPPDRWHADSVGSDRRLSVDYRLSSLPGERTQLTIRARRSTYAIGTTNPPRPDWERAVAQNWQRFACVLEREYSRDRTNPTSRPRSRRVRRSR